VPKQPYAVVPADLGVAVRVFGHRGAVRLPGTSFDGVNEAMHPRAA
jgi:hypothetical protein